LVGKPIGNDLDFFGQQSVYIEVNLPRFIEPNPNSCPSRLVATLAPILIWCLLNGAEATLILTAEEDFQLWIVEVQRGSSIARSPHGGATEQNHKELVTEFEKLIFPPPSQGGMTKLEAIKAGVKAHDQLSFEKKHFSWARSWLKGIGHEETNPAALASATTGCSRCP
jgi:hypothetical protein